MIQQYFSGDVGNFHLIFHHNLGLGDHFICNGLVHYLMRHYRVDRLYLISKQKNASIVRNLYQDFSDISVVDLPESGYPDEVSFSVELSKIIGAHLLVMRFKGQNVFFDSIFYSSFNVPFKSRWEYFQPPKDETKSLSFYASFIKHENYCLVHDEGSVGSFKLRIDTALPIYYVRKGVADCLLDWKHVIQHAAEIHCIDSSVIHFADSLDLNNKLLCYHDVNRGSRFHVKNNWKTINY